MRPLRSLMLGDCDCYLSPYIFGVQQGMTRLGHWHSQVNIRQSFDIIEQRIRDIRPDILWTHMLLWGPPGSPPVEKLVSLCERIAKTGCRVILHDGDYKEQTRYPRDISAWCALALCNHEFDRSAWKCQRLYWPYFAFAQDLIAEPSVTELQGKLFFAGQVMRDATYGGRSRLLDEIKSLGVNLVVQQSHDGNTLFRTAELSASADAVLGFGRPGVQGWIDTRVFQYPGAGAILIHDEAPSLDPWVHYVPYKSGSAESVAEAFAMVQKMTKTDKSTLRKNAFTYVQEKHSSVARVAQVLNVLFGKST